MIAFLHPSRFCASFGSSWCCFISLRTLSIHSVLTYLDVSSSHLHRCYLLCNVRLFSVHPLSLGLPRDIFLPPSSLLVALQRSIILCPSTQSWPTSRSLPPTFIVVSCFATFDYSLSIHSVLAYLEISSSHLHRC